MKCMNPKCKNESVTRGLCRYCYNMFSGVVKTGMITWQDLIDKGFALEAKKHLGRLKKLTDEELLNLQKAKYPNGVPSREAFMECIGGRLTVLSKKHRAILDSIFPIQNPTVSDLVDYNG